VLRNRQLTIPPPVSMHFHNLRYMRNLVILIFIPFLIFGCSKSKIQKEYYENGALFSEKVYPNNHDTSSYFVTKYYPTGEILNRFEYIKGKKEGGFYSYLKNGNVLERRNYKNDKLDGVLQYFDTTVNGKRILYCPCYESKNKYYNKQEFTFIKNDSSYLYGKLVIETDSNRINRSMSFCPIIKCKDTTDNIYNCFILEIIPPFPKLKYKITIGNPDSNLNFRSVDTAFLTRDSLIKICNLKFVAGINHLFCKITLANQDSCPIYNAYGDSAIMYAYKDVFVKSKKDY